MNDLPETPTQTDGNAALLRSILDNAPIGIWLLGADGRLGFVNKTYCTATGIPEARYLSVPHYAELYDADTARSCLASDHAAMHSEAPHISEEKVTLADGKRHVLEIIKVQVRDEGGQPTGALLGLSLDVTAHRALEERANLFSAIVENAREGVVITQLNGKIVEVNRRFCEIYGYEHEEVVGQTPRLLRSGRHDAPFYAAMWGSLREKGYWEGEIWNRRKDGTIFPVLLSIRRIRATQASQECYVGIFSDISALKKHEAHLEHIAYHDALTQLPNRVLCADRIRMAMSQTLRQGQKIAVCYLDLDGFKPINDRLGHASGDRLLIVAALRMKEALRSGDTVARMGGDEFVLLLNGVADIAECETILRRVLQAVALPVDLGGTTVSVTASLGVTLYPDDNDDVDTLIRHADHALYEAKEAGRNRYKFFDVAHNYEVRAKQDGRSRFAAALAAGQMRLYLQPKVDMRLGRVVGAEGLIRWLDPELGLLAPAQFLHFIENSAMDTALGEWVIRTALDILAQWQTHQPEWSLSINISPYHLNQEDFVARLATLVAGYSSAAPQRLEIEILETAALEDLLAVTRLMDECHALGVRFALDDFGTGYSSLANFRRLPISTLKIDQSFVRDMLNDDEDMAIVEGVIGLSRAFRRAVIAEGVETVEHGVRLLELGCDLAQGYGIARPMPADEFENWAAHWQPSEAWTIASGIAATTGMSTLIMLDHDIDLWCQRLLEYLAAPDPGQVGPPPGQDEKHCRFGQWLEGEGKERCGACAEYAELRELHRQLHALTEGIAENAGSISPCGATPSADCSQRVVELRDAIGKRIRALLVAESLE